MPAELILTNARVVTADRVINGTLMIRDGVIAALDEGNSQLPQAQDRYQDENEFAGEHVAEESQAQ